MPSNERSAEFCRGRLGVMLDKPWWFSSAAIEEAQQDLAAAEAREAGEPNICDLAVAEELDMLAAHIQQYIGPDDARDDIRRICYNRAKDLRRNAHKPREAAHPTAAEVIEAAEREKQIYAEATELRRGLVRRLDVLMNGEEGAAKQAALCDLVAQFPRWLAARDAQQRRDGAAEWLRGYIIAVKLQDPMAEMVWLSALEQAAQRLREGE